MSAATGVVFAVSSVLGPVLGSSEEAFDAQLWYWLISVDRGCYITKQYMEMDISLEVMPNSPSIYGRVLLIHSYIAYHAGWLHLLLSF